MQRHDVHALVLRPKRCREPLTVVLLALLLRRVVRHDRLLDALPVADGKDAQVWRHMHRLDVHRLTSSCRRKLYEVHVLTSHRIEHSTSQ